MSTPLKTLLLVILAAVSGPALFARQETAKPAQRGQTTPASASTMEAKWKEFGTPGTAHRVLDGHVGKWNVEVKMFEPGSTTPNTSKGTAEVKWIMDGRFIQETVSGEWMGQPFSGVGTTGYDNLKKKYVGTWIDNAATGLMTTEGTYDAAAKSFTYTGECPDLMAGKYARFRAIHKMVDADHWTVQTFKTGPDGKEFLAGQLDYTRAN